MCTKKMIMERGPNTASAARGESQIEFVRFTILVLKPFYLIPTIQTFCSCTFHEQFIKIDAFS